jgi:hypothetical protein
MPARPVSPTVETQQQTNRTGGFLEAWRYKADMARSKAVEIFLNRSGDLANTTEVHRALRSGFYAMHEAGLDCSPLITLLDEASRLSPDKDGKSRKEALQLLEESPLIIPGVGATGIHAPDEEVGRAGHLKRAIFGNPQP